MQSNCSNLKWKKCLWEWQLGRENNYLKICFFKTKPTSTGSAEAMVDEGQDNSLSHGDGGSCCLSCKQAGGCRCLLTWRSRQALRAHRRHKPAPVTYNLLLRCFPILSTLLLVLLAEEKRKKKKRSLRLLTPTQEDETGPELQLHAAVQCPPLLGPEVTNSFKWPGCAAPSGLPRCI